MRQKIETLGPTRAALITGGLALVLAAGLKAGLVASDRIPFNADEAIVALMARHILHGARPLFFYGQAYMGSLDAWLVAAGFALLGQQVWVIRLVQGLLYLGVLLTTGVLGRKAFGDSRVGALAMLLLAIPAVNVTLYTTATLGGYGEALLIGNLTLLVGLRLAAAIPDQARLQPGPDLPAWRTPLRWWGLLGFLTGLGVWVFGLALVYSLPVLAYLGIVMWKRAPFRAARRASLLEFSRAGLVLVAGALLGAAPWVGYALQYGLRQLLYELGGGAIAGVEQMPWIFQAGMHLASFLLLGTTVVLGFRPPWNVTWLALALIPFVLVFWMGVLAFIFRSLQSSNPRRGPQALLAAVMLVLVAGFVLTPFGADPSGRYFIPLAIPLALFAAAFILYLRQRAGLWAYGLVALLLVYHLAGTLQVARRYPPGLTTQFYAPTQIDHRYDAMLIEFLRQNGERRGYTNYWTAYPLAFLSGEELIFTPRLPYHLDFRHTERDNRYGPYNDQVAAADRVAYVTTKHPALDERLRAGLEALGVTWQETQIGDYQVFYDLSRPVPPEALGYAITTSAQP